MKGFYRLMLLSIAYLVGLCFPITARGQTAANIEADAQTLEQDRQALDANLTRISTDRATNNLAALEQDLGVAQAQRDGVLTDRQTLQADVAAYRQALPLGAAPEDSAVALKAEQNLRAAETTLRLGPVALGGITNNPGPTFAATGLDLNGNALNGYDGCLVNGLAVNRGNRGAFERSHDYSNNTVYGPLLNADIERIRQDQLAVTEATSKAAIERQIGNDVASQQNLAQAQTALQYLRGARTALLQDRLTYGVFAGARAGGGRH